jgi:hypothetical protein
MSRPDTHRRVYAWVPPHWRSTDAPRALSAVRLWGDVILELVAESEARVLDPPIRIRRASAFAWPTPIPPEQLAGSTVGHRRVELTVLGEQCAAARVDLVHELLDPVSWRRLREWLIDRGYDRDFIEEDVVALTDPTASMLVETARRSVESTSPALLDEIVSFFRPLANRYLDTWVKLSRVDDTRGLEVIVPGSAIVDVIE